MRLLNIPQSGTRLKPQQRAEADTRKSDDQEVLSKHMLNI